MTTNLDAEISERTKQRQTVGKIAYELRITREAVNESLARTGVRETGSTKPLDYDALGVTYRKLHAQGYTDSGISERMHISRHTANRIGRHLGLEANRRFKHDRQAIAELYRKGFDDERIAQVVHSTANVIQRIRLELGLSRTAATPIPPEKWEEIDALLDDGVSYSEASRTTGVSDSTIRRRFPGRGWTMEQRDEYVSMRRLADKLGVTT